MMDANVTGISGYKEVILMITGDNVFSKLKYESQIALHYNVFHQLNLKDDGILQQLQSLSCLKKRRSK